MCLRRSEPPKQLRRLRVIGRRGLAIRADSADPEAIEAAVGRLWSIFGKLDIAVVNAGNLAAR